MISPQRFVETVGEAGVDLFVGVPDSLLKAFSQHVMAELPRESHLITANEGAAVGVAMGHFLASGRPALVYLQNSGVGNAVNPLLSLADPEVYGVPMVVLVGWRGQPGVKDEPQHVKQGRVMVPMLEAMEVPHTVLPSDPAEAESVVKSAVSTALERRSPFVLLVEKGTFEPAGGTLDFGLEGAERLPTREDALGAVVAHVPVGAAIVSTTGMLSRELFELRVAAGERGDQDFLTVGGMGHASAIALGLAHQRDGDVWCLDGDGALLMHTGTLATIGDIAPTNYRHVVFNNGVHDSVGGQPTSIGSVDIPALAAAVGYRWAATVDDVERVGKSISEMLAVEGPTLLEVQVRPGARGDLGRPTRTPRESLDLFVAALRN